MSENGSNFFSGIAAASERLKGVANATPVMTSRQLNERTGARVFFKCENFQRAGAFKFRGAYNAISKLSESDKQNGVLTYSSGNHAQAIALAGSLLGIQTTVIMPENAPAVKRRATEGYGANVVLYEPEEVTREELAARIARESGLPVIPPYDHPDIVAGQGTVAKELFEQAGELDILLVPCGGGGLLSGCALSAAALSPACRVIGVEPVNADDANRSFRTRELQTVKNPDTIADGARTPSLGKFTFPLVLEYVTDMITVSDKEILRAMRFLWERMKIVVEPTGALAAAALLEGKIDSAGMRVGVVLSGGNVDLGVVGELFGGQYGQS